MKVWTREELTTMITTRNDAVERAMLAVWERQTADEKCHDTTRHHNAIGFSASTVSRGSYYAKWVKSGRHLTGSHLDNARKIALKHVGQLVKIANKEI